MTDFVPRTCTEIPEVRKNDANAEPSSRSLEEFRDAEAYVLLGAPGAGKTITFKQEAACSNASYVTARDFIALRVDKHPEWHNTTLFIDGLDERRAGSPDGCTPLDEIRGKLEQLDSPRFRLSCREADWFGANDRESLKAVSRNEQVTVLRLDPLIDADIHKILRDNLKVGEPEKFISKAQQQGLEALLANPKSLEILVEAVRGGEWPSTRIQTFNMACKTLLSEHDQGHRVAKPENVDISVLLDAAGRLCTVQLLAGCTGYTLLGTQSDHEYPGLELISGGDQKIYLHVLGTKLFESPSEGRAAPVHRHVAEFLGGQYLAGLIENGLPVGRILALMTGDDGGVVSEMRGLSAWLAAHNKASRMKIIECDPIGTVLYGDVSDFSIDEKRKLIEDLKQGAQTNQEFFQALAKMDSRFGDLTTPDMAPDFREALTSRKRDDTHQALVMILVEALRHGPTIPELMGIVLGVVKDDSWWPRIRYRALDMILQHGKNDEQTNATLIKLLADVHDGSVPDPDDELLGRLLSGLYPSRLSVSEIFQYLRIPKHRNLSGSYKLFWRGKVARNSMSAECAELLDILAERSDELLAKIQEDPTDTTNPIYHLPSNLLVRFLNTAQEEVPPDRLFSWLDIATWNYYERRIPPDGAKGICVWLNLHPEAQKAMIAACIEDCRGKQQFNICVDMKRHKLLFNATPPPDFGSWCLEQAIHATDDNAAIWYIREVADALYAHRYDEGLTREIVDERLAKHLSLERAFRERLSEREEQKNIEDTLREDSKKQENKEHQELRDQVKAHVAALHENRCPPSLLNYLAAAYFDDPITINKLFEGETSRDRLHNLLGNDTDLVEMVLTAFRDSVNRSDVPDEAEIIRFHAENRRHYLGLPFLVGLEELYEPEKEPPLNERQMRQAVAFYYSWPLGYHGNEKPRWYRWLLSHRPDVVSDVLIKSVRSELRNRKKHFYEAHELAFSKEHKEVARLASLTLLELFPVRCRSAQLRSLNVLLIAALLHCEREAFEKLIEHKLSFSSMNMPQRIYWLAAGFLASPASYRKPLKTSVASRERRIRHLAEFLTTYRNQSVWSTLFDRFDVQESELLIQLIGGSYRPYSSSSDFEKSDLINWLVQRLASFASPDATLALESLSSDESLHPWRYRLIDAAYQQNLTRREANFRHKDVDQVLQVLDNLKPANAADLAALTTDILFDMAKRIRDGSPSAWRQYWNMKSPSQPSKPRHEDLCRDTLLLNLRPKLKPLGIDAQQEGYYADDNRADIRVVYSDFNVPVEIKKSTHRNLWRAIREQLIAKYTRDPGTDGYGIYLVFWFGAEGCQMPPSGKRPTSAHELQERLLDTLSADEKFKISICVIDVSKP